MIFADFKTFCPEVPTIEEFETFYRSRFPLGCYYLEVLGTFYNPDKKFLPEDKKIGAKKVLKLYEKNIPQFFL